MPISRVICDTLRVPLPKPLALPRADDVGASTPIHDAISVLLVRLIDSDGITGVGFTTTTGSARWLSTAVEDELAPRLRNADSVRPSSVSLPKTVPAQARAAVDIALWDLAARSVDLPLWQYLGGARDRARAIACETAWPWLGGEQILAIYDSFQKMGVTGLRLGVGNQDPETDARRLQHVRESLGLDDIFSISGQRTYDAGTALAMGRFVEEELDADWFDDAVGDNPALNRLCSLLEVPVAAGSSWDQLITFGEWCSQSAMGVLRPDVGRLGISGAVAVAHLGSIFRWPVVPVLMPEVSVHLACGLTAATSVEYARWLEPVFNQQIKCDDGDLIPPEAPGLGLTIDEAVLKRFKVG